MGRPYGRVQAEDANRKQIAEDGAAAKFLALAAKAARAAGYLEADPARAWMGELLARYQKQWATIEVDVWLADGTIERGAVIILMNPCQASFNLCAAFEHEAQERKPAEVAFSHSEDLRSVTLRGKTFTLTMRQAQIIEVLWKAMNDGHPDVTQARILEVLGTAGSRVHDSFRKAGKDVPAWKALVKAGTRKGTYRLNL